MWHSGLVVGAHGLNCSATCEILVPQSEIELVSFFLFKKIFIFTLFYFTILYWFCHTLTWIHHGCTCNPKHVPHSHLPPHNIPLGHPRAPAPSMLYPASDIGWWFDSYMIVYMFQCPQSFPASGSFQMSQVSSLHQVAKVLQFQFQHQSFQWTPRTDLLQDELVGSPCSPRDSQVFSSTTV